MGTQCLALHPLPGTAPFPSPASRRCSSHPPHPTAAGLPHGEVHLWLTAPLPQLTPPRLTAPSVPLAATKISTSPAPSATVARSCAAPCSPRRPTSTNTSFTSSYGISSKAAPDHGVGRGGPGARPSLPHALLLQLLSAPLPWFWVLEALVSSLGIAAALPALDLRVCTRERGSAPRIALGAGREAAPSPGRAFAGRWGWDGVILEGAGAPKDRRRAAGGERSRARSPIRCRPWRGCSCRPGLPGSIAEEPQPQGPT